MPSNIKAFISLLVAAVGVVALYLEVQAGRETVGWVALALAVGMILAMWIFPETGKKKEGDGA